MGSSFAHMLFGAFLPSTTTDLEALEDAFFVAVVFRKMDSPCRVHVRLYGDDGF
jgi:hypothetical protein